jgi:hypothetical protein
MSGIFHGLVIFSLDESSKLSPFYNFGMEEEIGYW